MFTHRFKLIFIAAACAAFLAGCATGPKVRVDKDPAADLTAYKTFGFYDNLATDRARYSTITTMRLKQATGAQLRRLGYEHDEAAPALRVNFILNVANKQQIRSSASPGRFGRYVAWAGYPQDIETVDYKAGTLRIDLVDTKTNSLVWQGVAEGKLNEEVIRNPGAAVDAVVAEIFSNFPGAPKKK